MTQTLIHHSNSAKKIIIGEFKSEADKIMRGDLFMLISKAFALISTSLGYANAESKLEPLKTMKKALRQDDKFIISIAYFLYGKELQQLAEAEGKELSPQSLSIKHAVDTIGIKRVVDEVGLSQVIAEIGLSQVIAEIGFEQVMHELLKLYPPDKLQDAIDKFKMNHKNVKSNLNSKR